MYSFFFENVSEKFVLNGLNVKAVVAAFNQEKALLRNYESSDGTF